MKLTKVLSNTVKEHYAVGSFSPRYVNMIKPVLEAIQEMDSPRHSPDFFQGVRKVWGDSQGICG